MPQGQPHEKPVFDSTEPEIPVPGSETMRKGKAGRKQLLLLLGGFAFLLGIAIFGFLGGFISADQKPETDELTDGGASSLAPPEARPHGLDQHEKYDKYGYDGTLSTPGTPSAIDRQSAAGTQLLTGKDPSAARGSNEMITDDELAAINRQSKQTTAPYQTATERKSTRQSQLKRQFDHQQAERDAIYRTMHRSPKGREQVTEERTAQRERELDRKTADALLRQMETANQRLAGNSLVGNPTSSTSLNMAEYQQLKKLHNGELPPSYRPYFTREIDAENAIGLDTDDRRASNSLTGTSATFARKAVDGSSNGFYGLADQKDASSYTPVRSPSIAAVIHGDGDAVTVQNGSTIKIRLLENAQLTVGGKELTVPAHTLLAGNCTIGSDRVNIAVTTVRIGSDIYPISLSVFDLDGYAGLAVPKLADKNRVAQSAASSAGQAVNSPYYFVPQGTFGQQVGSQLAMQVTNTAFQGVRSLMQARLAAVRVTVKPNYRILLRANQQATRLTN